MIKNDIIICLYLNVTFNINIVIIIMLRQIWTKFKTFPLKIFLSFFYTCFNFIIIWEHILD